MSEAKDPEIKLFGRTIKLPEVPPEEEEESAAAEALGNGLQDSGRSSNDGLQEEGELCGGGAEQDSANKDPLEGANEDTTEQDGGGLMISNELPDQNVMKDNSEARSVDDAAASQKAEEEHDETSNSQDKTPKKPDKILPCPRCNSMDTKFCYYNNYNVNQPRHFCKNCHRYWTAGGTMRNVPVGAGRRKNKNSQCRHLTVSESLQSGREDLPNGIHHPTMQPNGCLLPVCSDTPLCESMASVLNIAEKAVQNCSMNGFHGPGIGISSYASTGNGDSRSGGSSISTGNSKNEATNDRLAGNPVLDSHNIQPQIACIPGAPWPYPWNAIQVHPPVPSAAFYPAGFPMPVFPAAPYWGCTMLGAWNVPWLNSPTASQKDTPQTSGPNSPKLGKHARDYSGPLKLANSEEDEPLKESDPEKCLWVPKTLRVVDPGEAAKSSIWETLGIKNDGVDSAVGGGLLKAFESKGDEKTDVLKPSPVLQANPAALSRSLSFHEGS